MNAGATLSLKRDSAAEPIRWAMRWQSPATAVFVVDIVCSFASAGLGPSLKVRLPNACSRHSKLPSRQSERRLESGLKGAATALPELLPAPTNAARLRFSLSESLSAKLGMRPPAFVSWCMTFAVLGLAASRSGPVVPDEPAALNVWQPLQPLAANSFLPATGSPFEAP